MVHGLDVHGRRPVQVQVMLRMDAVVEIAVHVQSAGALDRHVILGINAGARNGIRRIDVCIVQSVRKHVHGTVRKVYLHLIRGNHVNRRIRRIRKVNAVQHQVDAVRVRRVHLNLTVRQRAGKHVSAAAGDRERRPETVAQTVFAVTVKPVEESVTGMSVDAGYKFEVGADRTFQERLSCESPLSAEPL